MKLSRRVTNRIRNIVDEWLPPAIRDSYLLNRMMFQLVFGRNFRTFLNFRHAAYRLDEAGMSEWNRRELPGFCSRETDLNVDSLRWILAQDLGKTVLDVGCGSGFLAEKLAERYQVTGCDSHIGRWQHGKKATYVEAPIDKLPFSDGAFDTVISTHTLEHVREPWNAIRELRRVARRRLILAVPLQRPYRYTADLHVHFFPYPESFLVMIEPQRRYQYFDLGGDLLYDEQVDAALSLPDSDRKRSVGN